MIFSLTPVEIPIILSLPPPGLLEDKKWLITFILCVLLTETYPFLLVYNVVTDIWEQPSLYHENDDLSCILWQHWAVQTTFRQHKRAGFLEITWDVGWVSVGFLCVRLLRWLDMLPCEILPGPGGAFPGCVLLCWTPTAQDPPLVWFITPTIHLWLFLKAAPIYREYIYLLIYLFYCFSGKNAVRVISLFLDSASPKVCDFTVLTRHVPMHLSFPICHLLHIVCLEEKPDKSTGFTISHVWLWGGAVSQKLFGK